MATKWTVGKTARFLGIGVEFSGPIIAGALIGHFIDLYLHTDPWFTFVLFLLGVGLGFYRLIREVQLASRTFK
jgi:F0F1-type ATP synthase assembly protein I